MPDDTKQKGNTATQTMSGQGGRAVGTAYGGPVGGVAGGMAGQTAAKEMDSEMEDQLQDEAEAEPDMKPEEPSNQSVKPKPKPKPAEEEEQNTPEETTYGTYMKMQRDTEKQDWGGRNIRNRVLSMVGLKSPKPSSQDPEANAVKAARGLRGKTVESSHNDDGINRPTWMSPKN